MPVTYTLVGRLLTIHCAGSYSSEEMRRPWDEIASVGDLELPIACVLDVRDSESVLTRSIGDLRGIATSFTQRGEITDRRIALVTSGPARFGLMRMAATWVELAGIEARVFVELTEAQEWALSELARKRPPGKS